MKNDIVQIGFIGVGNFVTGNHLPNARKNPAVHIRALCDLDEKLLEERRTVFPCDYITTDYRKLLADPDIDMIIIGTRHDMHARLSVEAMKAGKDVLCEKPMSHDLESMREVVNTQKETGRRYVVGHNRRFAPAMIEAKRLIRDRQRPMMLLYRIVDDAQLWPAWPMEAKHGGKILSECCHIFDLLSWLIDAEPVKIHAIGQLEDNNVVNITYSDKSVASVVSGGLGSVEYPKELLEMFCGSATVAVDQFLHLKVNGIADESDKYFPFETDPWSSVSGHNTSQGFRERMKAWRENISNEDFERKYYGNLPKVDKGHYNEIDLLAKAIRENTPAGADSVDGARATLCSLKAIESLKTGLPVEIGIFKTWRGSKSDYTFR